MTELSGFYKLNVDERISKIKKIANLTDDEVRLLLNSGALELEKADKIVENVIGAVHIPMGLGLNFVINGKEVIIPMAVEEPSVIAAACKAAKLTLPEGFKAEAEDSIMIGQIQVVSVKDSNQAVKNIELNRQKIMEIAHEYMKPHERYGCGAKKFEVKKLETDRGEMIIVEFQILVGDAQGANMVNTVLENVAPVLVELTEGKVRLRIISNLADKRKTKATAVWKKTVIGEEAIEGILDAYEFAKVDVYRCATHNKGIMNGIDAVVLATGNDWRSVEAGAHAYAALGGYHSLTKYYKNENGDLVGAIELPLAVATVGPAINSSPTAKTALKIMDAKTSKQLAMAMACVGLANNVAALMALSTEGIQKGHMKLHARNVAMYAGANQDEIDNVAEILSSEKNFDVEYAKKVIQKIRDEK
ncbi:MAG: hydroxymethylglutaryl-CoA reductase, degradative [Candidatus Micrarchaeota archaeon]